MSFEKLSVVPRRSQGEARKLVRTAEGASASSVEKCRVEGEAPTAGEEKLSPALAASASITVAQSGTWQQIVALARYMSRTEVHTYAFSVAAQVVLSLFPFIVLLLTVAQRVFHSARLVNVVGQMMTNFLPSNQDFVMRNMRVLAFAHTRTRIFSVVMLLITTTGVFLPLEVALNSVWGVSKNRNYLHNQVVSLALAAGVCVLAMVSIGLSAAQKSVMAFIFFGHTNNFFFTFIGASFLRTCAVLASIGLFFLIYWGLPNRKIPALSVLPTAIVMGVLWEVAKYLYILALPHLDFRSIYGPFEVSVGLIMWAFISGLLLLAGAYVSATHQGLREARKADSARENTTS
jgi:YihY family inner membrane protein